MLKMRKDYNKIENIREEEVKKIESYERDINVLREKLIESEEVINEIENMFHDSERKSLNKDDIIHNLEDEVKQVVEGRKKLQKRCV